MIMIMIMISFISSLCYYIEKDFDSGFTDIPTAFYWVVITMTTVGYGDIFPVSGLGKFVGTFCAISGALTMSLPLPVIVSNFEKYYEDQIKLDLLRDRRAKYVDTPALNLFSFNVIRHICCFDMGRVNIFCSKHKDCDLAALIVNKVYYSVTKKILQESRGSES